MLPEDFARELSDLLRTTVVPPLPDPNGPGHPFYKANPSTNQPTKVNQKHIVDLLRRLRRDGQVSTATIPSGPAVGDVHGANSAPPIHESSSLPGIAVTYSHDLLDEYESHLNHQLVSFASRKIDEIRGREPICCTPRQLSGPQPPADPSSAACTDDCPLGLVIRNARSKIDKALDFFKFRMETACWNDESELYEPISIVYGSLVENLAGIIGSGSTGQQVQVKVMKTSDWMKDHGFVPEDYATTPHPSSRTSIQSTHQSGFEAPPNTSDDTLVDPLDAILKPSSHPTDLATGAALNGVAFTKCPHTEVKRIPVAPLSDEISKLQSLQRSDAVITSKVASNPRPGSGSTRSDTTAAPPQGTSQTGPSSSPSLAVITTTDQSLPSLADAAGSPGLEGPDTHHAPPASEEIEQWTIKWAPPPGRCPNNKVEFRLYQSLLELEACRTGLLHCFTWTYSSLVLRPTPGQLRLSKIVLNPSSPSTPGAADLNIPENLIDRNWSPLKLWVTLALIPQDSPLLGWSHPPAVRPGVSSSISGKRKSGSRGQAQDSGPASKRGRQLSSGGANRPAAGGQRGRNTGHQAEHLAEDEHISGEENKDGRFVEVTARSDPGQEASGDDSFTSDSSGLGGPVTPLVGDPASGGLRVAVCNIRQAVVQAVNYPLQDGAYDQARWDPVVLKDSPLPESQSLDAAGLVNIPNANLKNHSGVSGLITPCQIDFESHLASGRLWDVYNITFTTSDGNNIGHCLAKMTDMSYFSHFHVGSPTEARSEYTLDQARMAVQKEIQTYARLSNLQGRFIPRLHGVWVTSPSSRPPGSRWTGKEAVIMVLSDVGRSVIYDEWEASEIELEGDLVDDDESSPWDLVDKPTKISVLKAMQRLHDVGIVHGDPSYRHFTRDAYGRINVIDFDMSSMVSHDQAGEREKEEEMQYLRRMMRMDG